jgi:regulator of sigma E protease
VDKIRDVIGPGGKMIRSIIERTGVKIDVEDDGRVNVASADGESAAKAISIIQELTATPELKEITDNFGNTMRIGLLGIQRSASPDDWTLKRHDPLTAFVMAVKECYFVISRSLGYLYDVITGREAADQLGGPIRIAQVSGQVATAGFFALLNLAAIISVSIGLINLFPIPMLDGGHLLFYGIEAVRGKPLSENIQEIGFRIGLAFVLMLMIFATWNDLIHLKFL